MVWIKNKWKNKRFLIWNPENLVQSYKNIKYHPFIPSLIDTQIRMCSVAESNRTTSSAYLFHSYHVIQVAHITPCKSTNQSIKKSINQSRNQRTNNLINRAPIQNIQKNSCIVNVNKSWLKKRIKPSWQFLDKYVVKPRLYNKVGYSLCNPKFGKCRLLT